MDGYSNHFSLKHGGIGRARKHAAYAIGAERYSSREDVAHIGMGNMPTWAAADPLIFWEAADANERANGRAYQEFEGAIPRELTLEQAKKFVEGWIAQEIGTRHPYLFAIHNKLADDGLPNIHCHVMFSERIMDGVDRPPEQFFRRPASRYLDKNTGELRESDPAKGGAGKDRRWNDRQIVAELRGKWEAYGNKFLADHGYQPRLDLRSNLARGLDEPEPKIGPAKRKGDRWRDQNREKVKSVRQRRRRMRSLRKEVEHVKHELRAARRERAARNVCSCRDEFRNGQRPYRSPFAAMVAETSAGRTLYRWLDGSAAGLPAIVDRGNLLTLVGKPSLPKAQGLVQLAIAKGWKNIVLTGSDKFKRLAAEQALRHGLKVANPELADIVSQLEKEISHERNRHHPQRPRRAFTAWNDRGADRPGLRASRHHGPQHMPTLCDTRPLHEQQKPGNALLQRPVSGRGDRNNRVYGVHAGSLERKRAELARRWLATAASINALEAAKLKNDPERLQQIFESDPGARQWELIQQQRAEGITSGTTSDREITTLPNRENTPGPQ